MRKIESVLLFSNYLLGSAIVICQLYNLQSMVSLFFYGTFIVTLLFWVCTLTKRVDGIDFLAMAILVFAFINVVLNGLPAGASFTFQYMKKYIMFCSTIAFFSAIRKYAFRPKDFCWLEYLYLAIAAFFILLYFTQNQSMWVLNGRSTRYLVFRFSNPNLTALFLSCITMFLVVASVYDRCKIKRLIMLSAALFCAIFVFQTESRNAMIMLCIFAYLSGRTILKKHAIKFGNRTLFMTAVFPFVFAVLYLLLVQPLKSLDYFSFMVAEGKSLDSRVRIWQNAMYAFRGSPVFGAYFQLSNGTGTFQMHNTHLDILTSYGTIVLVLVCVFLYKLLCGMQETGNTKMQNISTIAFMCALLLGMGEAALFSGGLAVYLYFGVFLLFASTPKERLSEY